MLSLLWLLLLLYIMFVATDGYRTESFMKSQKYFRKVKDYGESLPPEYIMFNYAVHSKLECSLRCLQKSKCLAYNYRPKSDKFTNNCQLCNRTQGKKNHGSEEWSFYVNLKPESYATCLTKVSKGNKTGNLSIYIRSEGCEDLGLSGYCGLAIIQIDSKDYSPHGRGYNLVTINADTGAVYRPVLLASQVRLCQSCV